MDFRLTDDERALRDAARSLLDREVTSHLLRERYADPGARAERLWAAVTGAGWTSLGIPEEAGGLGLGVVATALVCEEAGRALAPVPLWETASLATALLREAGAIPTLGRICGGARATGVVAAPDITLGSGATLSGRVVLVPEAHVAELVVVPAQGQLFVVEVADAVLLTHDCLDRTRILSDLLLQETPAVVVGPLGDAAVTRATEAASVALSAQTLGTARRLLDATVAYVCTREQFGVPIGSFQAVQHKLADVLVAVERAWAATYYAAMAVQADAPDRSSAVAVAGAATADASRLAAKEAVQCHGGIGYTWEHDLHLAVRRVYGDQPLLGGAAEHRARLADLLGI